MERFKNSRMRFDGMVGSRLAASQRHWLLSVPYANPAMVERMRSRENGRDDELVAWYGEFTGKHLTASVSAWQISRSPALRKMITGLVDELGAVQDETGYLGPFSLDNRFVGNEKRRIWDLWGHYHIMLGLLEWHEASGDSKPLTMCLKAADAICCFFLDGNVSILKSDWSEMNTAVIHVYGLLYRKTSIDRYLMMMRHIENAWDDERGGGYVTAALDGLEFFQTRRPRWESLHPIQGILQLYRITADERYRKAFVKIWRSIASLDCHNTGGFSSGEQACGNPYDPGAIETCCTVAWAVLTTDMLMLTGDSTVADQLENTFYNAVLGAQSPSGRWWTYNTPMDGVKEASAHSIVFQALAGSPELNCCSVNGPRALALLKDWAFTDCGSAVAFNYYGPGVYNLGDEAPSFTIQTRYPYENKVRILLHKDFSKTLKLRIPVWSAKTDVRVNGTPICSVQPGQYCKLDRQWIGGDIIDIEFDFSPRFLYGERQCANKVSIYRGPLLLAYDEIHNRLPASDAPLFDPCKTSLQKPVKVANSRYARPQMLLPVDTGCGDTVMLCDFASAGVAGSRYATWLRLKEEHSNDK